MKLIKLGVPPQHDIIVRLITASVLQETQLSLTNRATYLCKCNGMADLKHAPPHMCYHAEFSINTGESQKLGSAGTLDPPRGMGIVVNPKIHAPP